MTDAGLIAIDKLPGLTSHDVVLVVRKSLGIRRVGHVGTLDPFATGLLPVLIGRATRLARFYSGLPKSYQATLQLGVATDTMDVTGQVIASAPFAHVDEPKLGEGFRALQGERDQIPPMFSAVKVGGRRLYEAARRGDEVERPPRRVTVFRLELVTFDPESGRASFAAEVSSGTYVRALADEVGRQVGSVAHLVSLRRTAIGSLTVEGAARLDVPDRTQELRRCLVPASELLEHIPAHRLDVSEARAITHGRAIPAPSGTAPGTIRLLGEGGDLLAMGELEEGGHLIQPRVVLRG